MTHGMTISHIAMFAVAGVAIIAAMGSWTTRINATFFFGRTVDPLARYSDEARAITRNYVLACWVAVLPCFGVILLGWKLGSKGVLIASVLLMTVAQQVAFARAHREAKVLTGGVPADDGVVEVALGEGVAGETQQEVWWVPGLRQILAPGCVALFVLLVAVVMAGAGQAAGLTQHWEALASGWDHVGNANLLGFGFAFVLVGTGLLLVFRTSARLRTRMAQYTLRSASLLSWAGVVVLIAVLVCALRNVEISQTTARVVMFAFFALAIGTQVWNQWRSKQLVPAPAELHGDNRWRWGLYYWNPGDPALFVQRRTGMGFTLNYGRGWAWVITVGFVGYLAAMLVLAGRR